LNFFASFFFQEKKRRDKSGLRVIYDDFEN